MGEGEGGRVNKERRENLKSLLRHIITVCRSEFLTQS